MNLSDIAIAVPVYDRPEYLRQCLAALRVAAKNVSVFCFIDPGDVETSKRVIAEADLAQVCVLVNPWRFGLGRQILQARRRLFEFGFQAVMLVESDIIVTEHIVPLLMHASEWCRGMAAASYVLYEPDPAAIHPYVVGYAASLMPKDVWTPLWVELAQYDRLLTGVDYRYRPNDAIHAWLWSRFHTDYHDTNQDCVLNFVTHKMGLQSWMLLRNRAVHIGEVGETTTKEAFHANAWDGQVLNPDPEDPTRVDFQLYDKNKPPLRGPAGKCGHQNKVTYARSE